MPKQIAMMTVIVVGAAVAAFVSIQGMPQQEVHPPKLDSAPAFKPSSSISMPVSAPLLAPAERPAEQPAADPPAAPTPEPESSVTVSLQVVLGRTSSNTYQVALEGGQTVYEVLALAGLNYNFPVIFQESEYGSFVDGIDGVSSDFANNRYWIWYINDQPATIGVNNYAVQEGDRIKFVYE